MVVVVVDSSTMTVRDSGISMAVSRKWMMLSILIMTVCIPDIDNWDSNDSEAISIASSRR